jgi:hypothetical protein
LNLSKLTEYDVADVQSKIIQKNKEMIKDLNKIIDDIYIKRNVIINQKTAFSIQDIVENLGDMKIASEYMLTKDKVDNLLAVKRFIVDLYKDQVKSSIDNEKKQDKELYNLKLKAFMDTTKNAVSNNPEYYFKALELLKKVIADGEKLNLIEDESTSNGLFVRKIKNERLEYKYKNNGINLQCQIEKRENDRNYSYMINGLLGKGTAEIMYSISLDTVDKKTEQIEFILGLDYLWMNYERVFIEKNDKKTETSDKNEALNKSIIDKAIDDMFFS